MNRVKTIETKLTQALSPTTLEVIDESHLHIGHAGAKSGKGHFRVRIASEVFSDKSRMAQHRMVYDSLGDFMQSDIHALAIEVLK